MRAVNVLLRPVDHDRLESLQQYLAHCGLAVGERTRSQAVRYALELAWLYLRGDRIDGQDTITAVRRSAQR